MEEFSNRTIDDDNQINLLFMNLNYERNYSSCMTLVPNKQNNSHQEAVIRIDDGWATIPESILIDLILATYLLLPYMIIPYLIRYLGCVRPFSNFLGWIDFFYGHHGNDDNNNNNKDKTQRFGSNGSQMISIIREYFQQLNGEWAKLVPKLMLPRHFDDDDDDVCHQMANAVVGTRSFQTTTTSTHGLDDNVSGMFNLYRKNIEHYKNSWWKKLKQIGCKLFTLNISDEQILKVKGRDAYQYLLFQRYLLILLFSMVIISVGVVLPVNVHSNSECTGFACTSMGNLPHGTWLCWFHANCSIFIIIIATFLMNRFANEIHLDFSKKDSNDNMKNNTILMIRPIKQSYKMIMENGEQFKDNLRRYYEERYPMAKIIGIQLIFNQLQLNQLQQSYRQVVNALQYSLFMQNNAGSYKIRPYKCCHPCCISGCIEMVDAVEYYRKQEQDLRQRIHDEFKKIIHSTDDQKQTILKTILLEFQTENMAQKVYKNMIRNSDTNEMLMEFNQKVKYAPYPLDMNWPNVSTMEPEKTWLWKILAGAMLFVIFFFLSTPTYVFKLLDIWALRYLNEQGIIPKDSIIMDYLSPLLMNVLASMMPWIVARCLQMIPYERLSELNHSIMINLYCFMVMAIIILPSAGFLTMNAMLDSIIGPSGHGGGGFRWQCLFPVDNGAFFVIYILHAGILGNLIEILRLSELVLHVIYYLFLIHSEAEYQTARRMLIIDFPLGVCYSQFLLIFTMTIIFSFASPLIVPFGLFYMYGKHLVDRYNIYHVYTPAPINQQIHTTAITFVYIGLVMMMMQLLSIMLIKMGYSIISKFVLLILIVSIVLAIIQCFCLNPILMKIHSKSQEKLERDLQKQTSSTCICSYVWPVFNRLFQDGFFTNNQWDY